MNTIIKLTIAVGTLTLGCASNNPPPASSACPQGFSRPGETSVSSGMHRGMMMGGGGASEGGMMGRGGMMMNRDDKMSGDRRGGMMDGPGAANGRGPMMGAHATPAAPEALTPAVKSIVDRVLQGERAQEQSYRQLADQFKRPFRALSFAEQRHAWALENIYAVRGLEAPKSEAAKSSAYKDLKSACAAGVAAEKSQIAAYDEGLKQDLPPDVRRVFTHLRLMAERHHLPIFERCD